MNTENLPSELKNLYLFDKTYLNILTKNYFNIDKQNVWGKHKLDSVRTLAEIFNDYIDIAEETFNFSNLSNLEDSSKKKLTQSIMKNLLFNFLLMEKLDLNTLTLFESLKEAYPSSSNTHPRSNSNV